jgi:hypothetical protein
MQATDLQVTSLRATYSVGVLFLFMEGMEVPEIW